MTEKEHLGKRGNWRELLFSLFLALLLSVDVALFQEEHVPYWAYAIKFVVLFLIIFPLSKRATKRRVNWPYLLFAFFAAVIYVVVIYVMIN
ncbi:hypothetical protein CCYS_02525 [Corynebacterium cystitidis DSM 20524]|nr:hypothetical protein CCYS_02525 [Corynebacterium cystitidis DSM 20524]SNV87118.1 Uncharacterised protein [Corynebacterium cystitidis]